MRESYGKGHTTIRLDSTYMSKSYQRKREAMISQAHNTHQGLTTTYDRIKGWWPTKRKEVHAHIRQCQTCQAYNPYPQKKPPVQSRYVGYVSVPFSVIHCDFGDMGVRSQNGNRYLLVIVDSTTNYTIAIPTRHTDAHTVVKALINNICHTHRTPTTIISDNGTHFTANMVKAVARAIGAQQSLVSPYHQSANGKAERAIGRIKRILGKMMVEKKEREKEWEWYYLLRWQP